MHFNKIHFIILISILFSVPVLISQTRESPYERPVDLVRGGAFIDLFLPVPIHNGLDTDVWGADNVIPRDADNGIESPVYSYWGGNIVIGDDGKNHLFVCRWPQDISRANGKSGHVLWWDSDVVHAVSDNPLGPFKVIAEIGKGHNPEIYRLKDGSYIIGVMGGKAYKSKTLDGPWTQIETTFDLLDGERNQSNRTYVTRDDGSILMMNKEGYLFISENADEHFVEIKAPRAYYRRNGSHEEDPVIWKDETKYNCIVNDCIGRVGYYLISPNGIDWTFEDGISYNPYIMKLEDGSSEDWWKLERPKVRLDMYGRVTHMSFAAIDTLKNEDRANDNHSSKNIVIPLTLARRLTIVDSAKITSETNEIKVKIFADDDFNPFNDIVLESLMFGASEQVNFGKGCKATGIEADGDDAIISFNAEGNGLTTDHFVAKLLGETKTGNLIYGYAKLHGTESPSEDSIVSHNLPDSVMSGESLAVKLDIETNKLCKVSIALMNLKSKEILLCKEQFVNESGNLKQNIILPDNLDPEQQLQWLIKLIPDQTKTDTTTWSVKKKLSFVKTISKPYSAYTTGLWLNFSVEKSSEQIENMAIRAFDGKLNTRWSGANAADQWVRLRLNSPMEIVGVKIYFYNGAERIYNIEIKGGDDRDNMLPFFSGTSSFSEDNSTNFLFDGIKSIRYLQIDCSGNSVNDWTSIIEVTPLVADKTSQIISLPHATENNIKIYPNPFTEHFTVNVSPKINSCNMVLYDLTGKLILQKQVHHGQNIFNDATIHKLNKGIYFLKTKGLKKHKIIPLIKQ